MVKVRIDLLRDDGLAAAPEEPDEVETPKAPQETRRRRLPARRGGGGRATLDASGRGGRAGRPPARRGVQASRTRPALSSTSAARPRRAARGRGGALALDPEHARAHYFRARALLALGRRADADEAIAWLVAREPGNPRVLELKAEAARVPEAAPAEVDGALAPTATRRGCLVATATRREQKPTRRRIPRPARGPLLGRHSLPPGRQWPRARPRPPKR